MCHGVVIVLDFNKVLLPGRWVCHTNIPLCGKAFIFRENENKISSRSCLQLGRIEMEKSHCGRVLSARRSSEEVRP